MSALDPAVAEALRMAAQAIEGHLAAGPDMGDEREIAAVAVKTFLRAPDVWRALAEDGAGAVAAAVERAGKERDDAPR